jgi:hypothetical protein
VAISQGIRQEVRRETVALAAARDLLCWRRMKTTRPLAAIFLGLSCLAGCLGQDSPLANSTGSPADAAISPDLIVGRDADCSRCDTALALPPTVDGTDATPESVSRRYGGLSFDCEALPSGDKNGCAFPVPGCLGYSGSQGDATTADLRFPLYCSVVLGSNHPYYPGSPVIQLCTEVNGAYLWVCPL